MNKSVKNSLWEAIICFLVLYSTPERILVQIQSMLRPPISWQRIQFIMYQRPQLVIMAVVYLLAVIILAVSLIRLIAALARQRKTVFKTAASASPRRTQVTRPEKARRKEKLIRDTEDAIHCDHKRGTEKYLEQIDSYLKAGLIDKAEYKLLYQRYSQLDIPDDYH